MNMNRISWRYWLIVPVATVMFFAQSCRKDHSPIKYPKGIFPDSVYALSNLNSAFDDYNMNLYVLGNTLPVIFSSNSNSSGGQFDLVQGAITFSFDQTNGQFSLSSELTNDIYYGTIISKANTPGNDFGPYSFFSSNDGYEYLIYASDTPENGLDLFFVKNLPRFQNNTPSVSGPSPVKIINSTFNDAYLTFDMNGDSIYFCSDRPGNFNIYCLYRNPNITTDLFLGGDYQSATVVDSINTEYNEKTPFVQRNVMVFSSDRPGGLGGYDIYYSVFRNGKWSSPVNMGPPVNSISNEYRPVLGYHSDFSNQMLIFSSDRPGGKGRYDLYFTGFSVTK